MYGGLTEIYVQYVHTRLLVMDILYIYSCDEQFSDSDRRSNKWGLYSICIQARRVDENREETTI